MPLIRGYHSGAKTILAHYHSVCKGQLPFADGFDWNSPIVRKMAALDQEQISFLLQLKSRISADCKSPFPSWKNSSRSQVDPTGSKIHGHD